MFILIININRSVKIFLGDRDLVKERSKKVRKCWVILVS